MLDKTRKTNENLQADLTDAKGEITITLNVHGDLINQHQQKLLPGKGVSITNFKIAAKTTYDHGDSECILVVDQHTSIENISPICDEYNFIPNTPIKTLLEQTEQYVLGTIGAIVTSAKKIGTQYTLEVKDGYLEIEKATASLFLSI